jgi:hypothetical protein
VKLAVVELVDEVQVHQALATTIAHVAIRLTMTVRPWSLVRSKTRDGYFWQPS